MKFLAILRDSVREALDAKVIYFLLALSALTFVAVGSLSFTPLPADTGLEGIFARFPGASAPLGMRSAPLKYEVKDFQQTNDATKPWEGAYRYDLIVSETPPPKSEDAGDSGAEKKDGKGKAKKKEPEARPQAMVFRLLILFEQLREIFRRSETDLTEEERATKERVLPLIIRLYQGQNLPAEERKKVERDLANELRRITPALMEEYIKNQLSAHGSMEVTRVRLEGQDPTSYRFLVECRSLPETYRSWPHTAKIFFGALEISKNANVGQWVAVIDDKIVGGIGAGFAMLLSTVVTAFFIPNMLRKGTIDLLVSKPIHRWALLLFKFVGGLTFMFLNTAVIVAGLWLILGLRSGLWPTSFLLTILILTFEFAIFYAISTLFGVLTRSPIVAILMACLAWVVLFVFGWAFSTFIEPTREYRVWPAWTYTTADVAHLVLPRYKDLDVLGSRLIAQDVLGPDNPTRKEIETNAKNIRWADTIGYTLAFIALLVGLACWRFSTKDY
jgi:ABC-type transport system involved in multi-copper enzyme maturation permease subunit